MDAATQWLSQLDPLTLLVVVPALVLLWLLYVLLPFAVFGIKGRLDRVSTQLADLHEELQKLNSRIGYPRPELGLRAAEPAPRPSEPALGLHIDQDDRLV
jgi:hypothetical protein